MKWINYIAFSYQKYLQPLRVCSWIFYVLCSKQLNNIIETCSLVKVIFERTTWDGKVPSMPFELQCSLVLCSAALCWRRGALDHLLAIWGTVQLVWIHTYCCCHRTSVEHCTSLRNSMCPRVNVISSLCFLWVVKKWEKKQRMRRSILLMALFPKQALTSWYYPGK